MTKDEIESLYLIQGTLMDCKEEVTDFFTRRRIDEAIDEVNSLIEEAEDGK